MYKARSSSEINLILNRIFKINIYVKCGSICWVLIID